MKALCWRLAVVGLLVPLPVSAQSNGDGLANLIPNLILDGIVLPGGSDPGRPHAGHFRLANPTQGSQPGSRLDAEALSAVGAVVAFGDRLTAQLANFPLGSSTGGFTYAFDEASGIYTRSSQSFGPAFTERALTIGRRKLSVGVNYQHTSFDTFSGEELRDGSITFYLPHTDCCNPAAPPPSPQAPGFEGDLLEAALRVNTTTDTVALFANYGVTDRLDVGLVVPITRVDLEAEVQATILRLSGSTPTTHTFVEGQDVIGARFLSTGSATGFGDIVLRTKYNFLRTPNTGLAAALDLRLPTGDENDLLGVGATQAKFLFILSSGNDRISPHVNIGYTFSGEGSQDPVFGFEPLAVSDEFNYAGGIEFVAHPRLTLLFDFLGRTLLDAGTVEVQTKTYQFRQPAGAVDTPLQTSTFNPVTGQPYRQLALQSGDLTLTLGAAGFKFNAATNLLVSANILFPLNNAGLRDRLTFAFGAEYAF
jgi:hypothetical protein